MRMLRRRSFAALADQNSLEDSVERA